MRTSEEVKKYMRYLIQEKHKEQAKYDANVFTDNFDIAKLAERHISEISIQLGTLGWVLNISDNEYESLIKQLKQEV